MGISCDVVLAGPDPDLKPELNSDLNLNLVSESLFHPPSKLVPAMVSVLPIGWFVSNKAILSGVNKTYGKIPLYVSKMVGFSL